jgi:hypothetical protein
MRTLATAQNAVIRDNHFVLNPVTGLYERSTLIERSSTNIVPRSEDFSTGWLLVLVTRTGGQDDPTGGANATLLQASPSGSQGEADYNTLTLPSATATLSLFVKKGSTPAVNGAEIGVFDSTASLWRGSVLLKWTGSTPTLTARNGATNLRTERMSRGWWRIMMTANAINTGNAHRYVIQVNDDSVVDPDANLVVFGAQLEDGPFASSYIASAGSATARSADTLALPLGAPLTTPQAMMIYVRFIELGTILLSSFQRVLQIGDGTAGLRQLNLRVNPGNVYAMVHETNGGSGVNSQVSTTPNIGDLVELVGLVAAGGNVQVFQYINGGAVDAGAVSAALALPGSWSANTVVVGGGAAAFQKIRMAAGQQTIATMRALAA